MAYSATWLNFASLARKVHSRAWMTLANLRSEELLQHSLRKANQQATVNGKLLLRTISSVYLQCIRCVARGGYGRGTDWDGR